MRRRKPRPELGSIRTGTLLAEDLIPAFADELRRLAPRRYAKLLRKADEWHADAETDDAQEVEGEILSELQDALDSLAPPFCYFGSLEGDGADFGFWFSSDAFETARHDGEVLVRMSEESIRQAGRRARRDNAEYVADISDHGSVTIYSRGGRELVSVV